MLKRVGKDAIGRATNSRRGVKVGRGLGVESLEGRQMMTAGIDPIATVTSPQYQGYQVPIVGTTTHAQTFTVTSDNPGIKASIAQGRFLTISVSHTAANTSDVTLNNATMTFQIFDDFTPITTSMITSLINGTVANPAPTPTTAYTAGTDYYNGKVIHRILNGFPNSAGYIVQGGSPNGDGGGNVFATPFADEFVQSDAFTGTGQLAMANAGADTNDTQFFITTGSPNDLLSYHHTIWGQLVSGQDTLTQLTQVAKEVDPNQSGSTDVSFPINPVTINTATLSNTNPDGVVHIDTTLAPVGATGNVTVTATDVTDNSTANQTFQVNVGAQTGTNPLRPFIGPYDTTLSIAPGQSTKFNILPVSPTPGDSLLYTVQGGYSTSTGAFTAIDTSKITATVDSNGVVTLTGLAGGAGNSTTLLIGVSDTSRAGTTATNVAANYEYHTIKVNVTSATTPVAYRPVTAQQLVDSVPGGTTPITLTATNPNATTTLPLTYAIATQPTHGTITNFDAATGTLDYTPTAGYSGPDAIAYTATDPNNNTTSFATTVQLNVTNASTGAVRFIADDGTTSTTVPGVLVVTPNPRTDGGTNNIVASIVNGNVQVTVNGVVDALEPTVANVDRLIIYGSKASDNITVDSSLTAITTLDGGHGGINVIKGGGGQTREHGWFGTNTLTQGSSDNYDLGRTGRVKFVKGTGTSNVLFKGEPGYFRYHLNHNRQLPVPTTGTYYKFASNKKTLVPTTNPYATLNKQQRAAREALNKQRRAAGTSTASSGTAAPGAASNQAGTVSNGTAATGGGSNSATTGSAGSAGSNI